MLKLCLTKFFEILTSQIKSQLISAVCLHFFKKIIKSYFFSLDSEKYITDILNMYFVYIFELVHKSADFKNANKMLFKIDSYVILRI